MSRTREEVEAHFRHAHHVGGDKKYIFERAHRQELVDQIMLEVLLDIREATESVREKLENGIGVYNA